MALKAGYVGIKKLLQGVTAAQASKLDNLPAIETIGAGLSLSDEGVLSASSDGSDMYDVTGAAVKIGKYKDSNGTVDRYRAVIHYASLNKGAWNYASISALNVDKITRLDGVLHTPANGDWGMGYRDSTKGFIVVADPTNGLGIYVQSDNIFTGSTADVVIEFTQAAAPAKSRTTKTTK